MCINGYVCGTVTRGWKNRYPPHTFHFNSWITWGGSTSDLCTLTVHDFQGPLLAPIVNILESFYPPIFCTSRNGFSYSGHTNCYADFVLRLIFRNLFGSIRYQFH